MRVTFNEITKDVVRRSIAQPARHRSEPRGRAAGAAHARPDRRLSAQSRCCGKRCARGLSAGRVQSVATRLVVDRENEIRAFVPQEYWSIDARLERVGRPGSFTAHYYGDPKAKRELHSAEEVEQVLSELKGQSFGVKSVKKPRKKRNPAPPFITSTLQQEASRKLNMTPRRTMIIAQELYEGVEITGEYGSVGLITYMRTDSLRISEEALEAAAKGFITAATAQHIIPARGATSRNPARRTRTRPSGPATSRCYRRTAEGSDEGSVPAVQLIWSRFIASQMERRRLRRDGHRGRMRKASVPRDHQSIEIRRFHGNL